MADHPETRSAGEKNVLAVDVGNTTTRLGLFAGGELVGTWELTTPERLTADEARAQVAQALSMMGSGVPEDAILACVVPSLTDVWRRALAASCPGRAYVVGPGLRTGLRMRYDDPSEVGADRVADVVAARERYGAPVVVVDLGTTTNFEVVDADGAFAGGIIAPGVALGARSLAAAAARLPVIELRAPGSVVGRNTRAAMQSGVVLGEVARIDGLLDMIASELGGQAAVVLTGEGAASMAALLRHEACVDDTLTLRGLWQLWRANVR
ncbi:type III pantothenate kinase [Olsenella sp. An188]|uniref:type III pantothenate kinase n=1 Tax=Olsenella sp. An188 TaxID=1965579 RepID=UPI000B3AB42E|nr:type III pantothenate kinase [Olsenella sp. An188]OUP38696.1 type III pantothenate kinase [Olsenella sp. An188]